jgi:hypothetical protein
LRDVWVHRAGRVDARALDQAPTLRERYQEGQFVRFTADDYRTYSAALRCYGEEVIGRLIPPAPEHRVVLSDWRLYRAQTPERTSRFGQYGGRTPCGPVSTQRSICASHCSRKRPGSRPRGLQQSRCDASAGSWSSTRRNTAGHASP